MLRPGRLPEPEKITSSMPEARMDLYEFSPMTQRMASTRFDLPHPFGPTTPVRPGSIWKSVASQKLLKPTSLNLLNFIPVHPHADPARRSMERQWISARRAHEPLARRGRRWNPALRARLRKRRPLSRHKRPWDASAGGYFPVRNAASRRSWPPCAGQLLRAGRMTFSISASVTAPTRRTPLTKKVGVEFTPKSLAATSRASDSLL